MNFTPYTESLFVSDDKGKLKLDTKGLQTISNFTAGQSLFGLLGTDLPISDASTASVTFLRNLGQAFADKTQPGLKEVQEPKLSPITLTWNKPKQTSAGFMQADIKMGIPNAAAIKLERANSDFYEASESEMWKYFEKEALALNDHKHVKDLTALDGKKIFDELVAQAIKVSQTVSEEEGISRINKNKIIIFVKEEIFVKLQSALMIGNNAAQMALGDSSVLPTIAGYRIVPNPYLNEVDAIIATSFTAASMININSAKVSVLEPTDDLAFYYEAMNLYGLAYKSCFKYIVKA